MTVVFPDNGYSLMKEDPLKYFKKYVKLYKLVGAGKYFWFCVTFIKIFIFMGRTIYAYQNIKDPNKLAAIAATYPVRFMGIVKLIFHYVHKDEIMYIFKTAEEEFWDFHIAEPTLQKQIKTRFFWTNTLTAIHASAAVICIILLVIFPLDEMPEGMRSLPNIIWTPFDTNPSPMHEILYVYLIWNIYLSLIGNVFFDVVYIYTVQHVHVQFSLLKELLKNITRDIAENESDLEKFKSEYFQYKVMERLKICLKHHKMLLRIGRALETYASTTLGAQLIMSYLSLVVNGYILSVDHSDFSRALVLSNLTFNFFVQLSVYSMLATSIRTQSVSVLGAVIESEWYLFQNPIKRALVIFLLNSEQGIDINAAGMKPMTNELLVDILKNVFSAITLLQALILGEDNNG